MTYGQIRDAALRLINQYSIAGNDIALSYNNQADYVKRIPSLVNDCLIYLSGSVRYLPAQVTLDPTQGEDYGRYKRLRLPGDFYATAGAGLLYTQRESRSRFMDYKLLLPSYILIDKKLGEPVIFEYFRTPYLIDYDDPDEDTSIDCDLDVQSAIPFYVAAHLVLYDDQFMYASLYNEFENKVDRLHSRPSEVVVGQVEDVYGMSDVYGSLGG